MGRSNHWAGCFPEDLAPSFQTVERPLDEVVTQCGDSSHREDRKRERDPVRPVGVGVPRQALELLHDRKMPEIQAVANQPETDEQVGAENLPCKSSFAKTTLLRFGRVRYGIRPTESTTT